MSLSSVGREVKWGKIKFERPSCDTLAAKSAVGKPLVGLQIRLIVSGLAPQLAWVHQVTARHVRAWRLLCLARHRLLSPYVVFHGPRLYNRVALKRDSMPMTAHHR